MFNFIESLIERASTIDIIINQSQAKKLEDYVIIMLEWNKKMNLTAITEPMEVIDKHIIDSLIPCKELNLQSGTRIIDVGSGAGFPGIPLKIMYPDVEITMMDSSNKKVVYLREVASDLLIDVNCVHARAELAGQDVNFREQYDIAISRAVANLPVLSEYCIPFVKVGGVFVAMKGANSELNSSSEKTFNILGGRLLKTQNLQLPNEDKRAIIYVEKKSITPSFYPRNSKKIKDNPIA